MRDLVKRLIDIVLATSLLVIFAPLMAIVAVVIRVALGSPVVFVQARPGLNGERFFLRKFRTMSEARDRQGRLQSDGERLGPLGRFLRASSLDELPQLWNILSGDMSFVGPRPLLVEYLPLYSEQQNRRHEVRPGLTGWAQIHGRNAQSWEQRFALDVWYVDHRSLWLDIRILLITLYKVATRKGISQAGSPTMPRFNGNQGSPR
jgi:lipopolysaccharide/colanic/teichoic acid biosynthesis glycosyltransferase